MEEKDFPMRINKYLANMKRTTRRGADELIKKKLVFINDERAELGSKVNKGDKVEIREKASKRKYLYFAYNKPRGVVTHSPQYGDKEIKDVVNIPGVFPIGRLDKDSSGLIILTNDGRITEGLLSPDSNHEKEYFVRTKDKLRKNFKQKMAEGVDIEDYKTLPAKVEIMGDKSFKVVLTEGKRHQIRRMCVALFCDVQDLERIRIMNIKLDKLKPGESREIKGDELKDFLRELKIK